MMLSLKQYAVIAVLSSPPRSYLGTTPQKRDYVKNVWRKKMVNKETVDGVELVEDDSPYLIRGRDLNFLIRLIPELNKILKSGQQRELQKHLGEVLVPNTCKSEPSGAPHSKDIEAAWEHVEDKFPNAWELVDSAGVAFDMDALVTFAIDLGYTKGFDEGKCSVISSPEEAVVL
jgi:hypothetical protein